MRKFLLWIATGLIGLSAAAQGEKDQTLLWKISGNGLAKPSYLFGTIHMICGDDIQLSDSLRSAIRRSDDVYLELDMDNMFELMGAMTKMKMNGDTTLADLLTPAEYAKVKAFFSKGAGLLPFNMLETFKPLLAASTLMQNAINCDNAIAMEQLVMKEAKYHDKSIKGLETMAFQMSIFDSIPYTLQAKQLLEYVESDAKGTKNKEFETMVNAYRSQDLKKLEAITLSDEAGMKQFTDILLYNRNARWAAKLQRIMGEGSVVIAVGAGHLPGDRGLITLLRKMGYTLRGVQNNMVKKESKEL